MELKIWAKTFYSVYRCLEKLANAIDKFVEIKANNCMFTNLNNITLNNTLTIAKNLTYLTNKKINLINMKLLTEKVLTTLEQKYAQLIIMHYIDNKSFFEISEELNLSLRTTLRWHSWALTKSARILKSYGYDDKKITKLYQDEKWFFATYEKLKNREVFFRCTDSVYKDIIITATREYRLMSY